MWYLQQLEATGDRELTVGKMGRAVGPGQATDCQRNPAMLLNKVQTSLVRLYNKSTTIRNKSKHAEFELN